MPDVRDHVSLENFHSHILMAKEKIAAALAVSKYDVVVISSDAELLLFRDDTNTVFNPNPYLLWLVNWSYPSAHIAVDTNSNAKAFFRIESSYWEVVPPQPPAEWSEFLSITTGDAEAEAKWLNQYSDKANCAQIASSSAAKIAGAEVNPANLMWRLDHARAHKSLYEIENMAAANIAGLRGHYAAQKTMLDKGSEFDCHMAFLQASGQTQKQQPYSGIVAFDKHSATLHYNKYDCSASAEYGMLVDAGAVINGYASDISRTISCRDDDDYARLIADITKLQQQLCKQIAVDKSWQQLQYWTLNRLGTVLVDHGIISAQAEDDLQVLNAFMPHGIGHLLGIQVHDPSAEYDAQGNYVPLPNDLSSLRLRRNLTERMAVTVEPGVYFIPQLVDALADKKGAVNQSKFTEYCKYGGVRIEDNLIIRSSRDEPLNLTENARLMLDETNHHH